MLSSILKKSDCHACKFCCSFRRKSLWETPVFDSATKERLSALFPNAKFRKAGKSGSSFTFDISGEYKTSSEEEEAPCPFLDTASGCRLPAELKPFDCSIWPLRAIKTHEGGEEKITVSLTPTCPAINALPKKNVLDLVDSGLGKRIVEYAKSHPDIIKEESDFLTPLA